MIWYWIVPYLVEDSLAAERGIRYRMLVAATEMYGSGGQAAFGSLGVSDAKLPYNCRITFGSLSCLCWSPLTVRQPSETSPA